MFLKSVQVDQYPSKVISKCTYKFTCTCGSTFIEKTERRASTKISIVPLFQKNILLNYFFRVEAHIEITCTKDYYGQRCEVYCTPLYGLWECDENTGARICSKPCLHGKCVLTR